MPSNSWKLLAFSDLETMVEAINHGGSLLDVSWDVSPEARVSEVQSQAARDCHVSVGTVSFSCGAMFIRVGPMSHYGF